MAPVSMYLMRHTRSLQEQPCVRLAQAICRVEVQGFHERHEVQRHTTRHLTLQKDGSLELCKGSQRRRRVPEMP